MTKRKHKFWIICSPCVECATVLLTQLFRIILSKLTQLLRFNKYTNDVFFHFQHQTMNKCMIWWKWRKKTQTKHPISFLTTLLLMDSWNIFFMKSKATIKRLIFYRAICILIWLLGRCFLERVADMRTEQAGGDHPNGCFTSIQLYCIEVQWVAGLQRSYWSEYNSIKHVPVHETSSLISINEQGLFIAVPTEFLDVKIERGQNWLKYHPMKSIISKHCSSRLGIYVGEIKPWVSQVLTAHAFHFITLGYNVNNLKSH